MPKFNPNDTSQTFTRELIPEGTYACRVARVIEIGKHLSGFPQYDDEGNPVPEEPKDKVVIVLSIPDVLIDIGGEQKQAFISKGFGLTISNSERSTLKQYTNAFDPEHTINDLGGFLNKTGAVTIKHKPNKKGDVYADILSVAPLLKGMEVPELDTEPVWFEWDNPSLEVWNILPDFQKQRIQEAVNFQGSPIHQLLSLKQEDEEELPF